MRRPLLILSVAAGLSLLAFIAHPRKTTNAANFSDREIFEGVVFGVGPVADLVPEARDQLRPEIYARSADQLASMAAVRATLMVSIERAEPGLIGEFGRVARSGDPAAIRSMLERAAEAVDRAAADDCPDLLDGALFANVPSPQLGPTTRPRPGPTSPQIFANVPSPQLGPTTRPRPGPNSPQIFANVPSPQLGPTTRPRPGPTSPQLFANVPSPQLGPTTRPRPGPTSPQIFANVPSPQLGPTTRPRPGPNSPQIFANVPSPQLGPTTRPRPGPTSPQLVAQPGWALFSSELFSEQLAASMAVQLDRSAPAEG